LLYLNLINLFKLQIYTAIFKNVYNLIIELEQEQDKVIERTRRVCLCARMRENERKMIFNFIINLIFILILFLVLFLYSL